MKIIFSLFCLICVCRPCAWADEPAVIPAKFTYQGVVYKYDPYWKDEEVFLKANIDDDSDLEIIVGFGAVAEKTTDKVVGYFFSVYDMVNGEYSNIKTRRVNNYPCNIILHDLNGDGANEVIIYGKNTINLNSIYIYQWRDQALRQIYGHSTLYGIYIDINAQPPFIEIGAPNWAKMKEPDPTFGWHYMAKPLREIYVWNGETFAFDDRISTAEENYTIQKFVRGALYQRDLFENIPSITEAESGKFEYMLVYLDNKKFYYVFPPEGNNIDYIHARLGEGVKLKMQKKSDGEYSMSILLDQEISFMARHDASRDGVNPVHVFGNQ